MGAYFDDDWSPRFTFGEPRDGHPIEGVCIHTTENDAGTPASNIANYQITTETGSYHVVVDTAGTRLRENTDDWRTWSTGNKGNDILLHLSFVARAAWSRDQWLAQDRMLRAGATVVAYWCKTHGIPVRRVDVHHLPGITTHSDTRDWGVTNHTDPGPNFPFDVFLRYVNEELTGRKTMAAEGDLDALRAQIQACEWRTRLILDQLAGPGKRPDGTPDFTGWDITGGKTLVETVADIERKLDALLAQK